MEACVHGAISFVDDLPVTDIEKCQLCGQCMDVCLAGAREIIGEEMTVDEVLDEIEKDRIFYDESGGGATFSGGEPLMQQEFLSAMLDKCRIRGIQTAIDTTCYAKPETIRDIAGRADMFLCDIKHMDTSIHKQYTGVENDLILDNIRELAGMGFKMVIRIPIIPDFNDDEKNIENTVQFVKSLGGIEEIDILPYNRGGLEKSVRLTDDFSLMQTGVPSDDKMEDIANAIRRYGFEVKIGG